MIKFIFERGYICCGCNTRHKKQATEFTYRRNCLCKDCFSKLMPYSKDAYHPERDGMEFMAALFRYKGLYRKIFLDFKFGYGLASGHLLGKAMSRLIIERDVFTDYDYIVPVPVSKTRYNERGYNQSHILATYISKALNIPILNVMERVKHSPPQSTVSHYLRADNVNNAFVVSKRLDKKNVILFDDIYTTGSTAAECTYALHRAGADKVCVLVGAYNVPQNINHFTKLN